MRVLVIDDDPAILRLLSHVLRSQGHEPVLVTHPSELEGLSDAAPDAAVVDWHLADQTCEATTQTLRDRFPGMPTMIMTADCDLDLIQRALKLGATCWWLKNAGIENLRRQLNELLQSKPQRLSA